MVVKKRVGASVIQIHGNSNSFCDSGVCRIADGAKSCDTEEECSVHGLHCQEIDNGEKQCQSDKNDVGEYCDYWDGDGIGFISSCRDGLVCSQKTYA